jgi:hypothetical protein
MKSSKTVKRTLLLTTLIVFSLLVVAGVYSRAAKQRKPKDFGRTYQPAQVQTPPQVVSKVKGLEITGVNIVNQGTQGAELAIDVTNNRNESVMALDFIAGTNNYSGLSIDGLLQEGNPRVIIPPHTLKTFNWSLGEIMEGQTVSLAAAVFADGKEEGDKRSLEGLKKGRVKFQKDQREKKAKQGGQQ